MINSQDFGVLMESYKDFLKTHWDDEDYKWVAIKHFLDNWKIDAPDFKEMFMKATERTDNLLAANAFWQPRDMIRRFCEICGSDVVKQLFVDLFNENVELRSRIESFINAFGSENMIGRLNSEMGKNWKSNQDTRAVSVYLALMFPDKYYFYMESLYNESKNLFDFKQPKGFSSVDKMMQYFKFCNDVRELFINDNQIVAILNEKLEDKHYKDFNLNVTTQNFMYYISELNKNDKSVEQDHSNNENKSITYVSEIILALTELGGIGHLKDINQIIEDRGVLPYIHRNPNWKYAVSSELQKHCKDTKSYVEGNENLFYEVSKKRDGMWGLNEIANKNNNNKYTQKDFLNEVYISPDTLDSINYLLKTKKNIILQGAPGVGKTYAAKRIAYEFMGEKNNERICFVQFHQSYSYEDFVIGYKPNETGFSLETGVFFNFCAKAKSNSEQPHFFIIDEINRGNISKIFGELLMLIEADKRNEEIMLSTSANYEKFSVPDNLYIIGMMNTADRSLAMIDYALRRRFSFVKFEPAFNNASFIAEVEKQNNTYFSKVIEDIRKLNEEIKNDVALGEGFMIGHSYFCLEGKNIDNLENYIQNVVNYDILPLLEEYWFDNEDKYNKWKSVLTGASNV